eukprot:g74364.t1
MGVDKIFEASYGAEPAGALAPNHLNLIPAHGEIYGGESYGGPGLPHPIATSQQRAPQAVEGQDDDAGLLSVPLQGESSFVVSFLGTLALFSFRFPPDP